MNRTDFESRYDVSRETIERLDTYEALLRKWTPKINLVAPSTLREVWSRHFSDSAVLWQQDLTPEHWVDLGSGGGFPGLVLAILNAHSGTRFSLVEADTRKAVFLRQVIRETGINATVHTARIEALSPLEADVISARALASLPQLLEYMHRHAKASGVGLFPKGVQWQQDLRAAQACWTFKHSIHPGGTDSEGVVLRIEDLSRA